MPLPASGANVGHYVLLRELGKGAMATVYEAKHVDLGKRVALKAMHPHLAVDETASSRFLREGKAAAQIHSPHVVDVFDVGTHEGVPYLVMELLDGVDLAALLRERGKLSLREIADLMLPIASAVDAAHQVGVIHRDLKPSNVLLARRDGGQVSPTILDFGISKVTSDVDWDLTASEVLLGTVHYMSPEQTRGGRNASAASDQYALGVMLYECATGTKPFAGGSPYALMHAIVSTKVTPPSALDPSLPAAFDEVVLRAMHRDPKRRFPSVRALGAALVPWASDEVRKRWAPEFGVDASALTPPRGWTRRKALALAVLALVGTATGLAISARPGADRGPSSGPLPEAVSAVPLPVAQAAVTAQTTPDPPAPSEAASASVAAPAASPAPPPTITGVALPPRVRRPPPPPVPAASASSPRAAPERGTNGALIVE